MLAMFQPRNVLCLFASKPINRFRTKYGTTPRWEIKPVYLNMENQYPLGNNLLPEIMLTKFYVAVLCHQGPMS